MHRYRAVGGRLEVASAEPEDIETGLGQHKMDLVVRGTIDGRPVVVVCEVISPQTLAEARQRGLRVPTNKSGCALFLRSGEDLDTLSQ